ncbi:MAG: TerC/Alx family metal homeostasis membrane protein [Solitalea-like symbiont of Tyrophagus putrescentiae]
MFYILNLKPANSAGHETIIFSVSIIVIVFFLLYDLGIFNKNKAHQITTKEALLKTCLWVSLSVIFFAFLYFKGDLLHGITNQEKLLEVINKFGIKLSLTGDFATDIVSYKNNLSINYLTGYLMEYALSVDNVFVIILILQSFTIDPKHYHKILFLGIIGAIIMRFILIFVGSILISKFAWILYIFGLFLIYAGIQMFVKRNHKQKIEIENYYIIKLLGKFIPIDKSNINTGKFFTRINGKLYMTSTFIALIVIEFSDLVFALDSIPAIFAITKDPYIIFFSNIFAILGLRSLFFLLSDIVDKFRFLKIGLSILLVFIGLKMLFANLLYKIGYKTVHSLIFIVIILVGSIILSQIFPDKKEKPSL